MTYGALMLDLAGVALTKEDVALLENPVVGGVVLFTRNYQSPEQLSALVKSIRTVRSDLLLTVDQEGGRVQRFRGHPFSSIPPMGLLGRIWEKHPDTALELARESGWVMATEILSFGIDLSFAPVLDIDYGISKVIGDRAFSGSAKTITVLAGAFRKGMNEAGMAAIGKHFPGHGGVKVDSHIGLPKDKRTKEELQVDVEPFRDLIKDGLEGIMPAHVIYEQLDDQPAGFSAYWLQTVLRQQLNFTGAIVSDCLSMAGAKFAGSFPERAKAALDAGCDTVLVCNDRAGAIEVVQWLESINHSGAAKLLKLKGNTSAHHSWEYLAASERRQHYHARLAECGWGV